MTPEACIELVRAREPRVVVVGDYLLDGWWSGRIGRIAREAPAPVVDLAAREYAPGGAANTALNLASLGARVEAVGAVGDDEEGRVLRTLLEEAGVDVSRLRPVSERRTTTKVRVVADDQVVVRLDECQREPWPTTAQEALAADVAATASSADAQVFCDYGTLLSDGMIAAVLAAPRPSLRLVDSHDPARWRAMEPDLVTPNAAEAELAVGEQLGKGEERASHAASLSERLLDATGAGAAVVTLDRSGTVLLRRDQDAWRTHAHPLPEKQAAGAGDVFVAALTVARSAGATLEDATAFAQQAADVGVQKTGTCVCSLEELGAWIGRPADAAMGVDELADALSEHRRTGERIVFTNGCFDVLHRGHTTYLRQARRLGDVLVVAVNADSSVRRLKGPDRPVNNAVDRANVLAELSCVDYVTVFDEDTPRALIERVRPDVYAKGGDYTPEMLAETETVRAVGGEVRILDYVSDHSTTRLIDRIRDRGPASRADARTSLGTRAP